jgi:hypothetical protein
MRVVLPVQVLRTDKPLVMVHPVAELRVLDRACGAPDGPDDVAATGQTSAPVRLSVTEAWSVLLDSR